MTDALVPVLRTFFLFAQARDATLRSIAAASLLQKIAAGVEINTQGAVPRFLICLISGSVEGWSELNGERTIVGSMAAPTMFEFSAGIHARPAITSTVTREPSEIVAIDWAVLRKVMREDAAVSHAALLYSAEMNRYLVNRLLDQKLRRADQRLASWLLDELARDGGSSLRLTFSKQNLAAELGMSPANLSRIFHVLRNHGVDVRGRAMTVTDIEKLRLLAGLRIDPNGR